MNSNSTPPKEDYTFHDAMHAATAEMRAKIRAEVAERLSRAGRAGDAPLTRAAVIDALRAVHDPELPVNLYDLGLIYAIDLSDGGHVTVTMTLTAPGCPVAGEMPALVEAAVMAVPGVVSAKAHLTFDPPWDRSRMSDEAKLTLGLL